MLIVDRLLKNTLLVTLNPSLYVTLSPSPSVILSPSLVVILSEAKNLKYGLRTGSAKNLRLPRLCLAMTLLRINSVTEESRSG